MRSNTTASILSEVNGITARVGVIASSDGTAKTNQTTATTFLLQPGGRYVVQADKDIAITATPLLRSETDIAAVTADPLKDLVVPQGQACMVCLLPGQTLISIAAGTAGTAFNAKVLLLL
jgi:hypothetical protein